MLSKRIALALVLVAVMACAVMADPTDVTMTAYPSSIPDEELPRGVWGDSPGGWTTGGCWQGPEAGTDNKTNWHARYLADGDYLSILFPNEASSMTIDDIASISYYTNRPDGTPAGQDWAVFIYTRPDGSNDKSSWYGYRFVNNYGEHTETDAWTQYSTSSTSAPMTFTDNAGNAGSFSGQNLDYLKDNFGSEYVEMISIQTMSNYNGFDGYMDGLEITLTSGSVGQVNFEPVPLPPSAFMLLTGVMGVGGFGVWRKRRGA